jgi:hypothetical protein
LPDTLVQSQIEVDEGIGIAPQLLLDFFTGDQFTRAPDEKQEKFQRLGLEADRCTEFRESSFREIQAKNPES